MPSSSNSYLEALTRVTVFGDKISKEVTEVK